MEVEMRECRKCNQTKPLELFVKHKKCKNGYSHKCMACLVIDVKAWKSKNKEKNKNHLKKYAEKNKDSLRKSQDKWRKANKDRVNELARSRYEKNPQPRKEQGLRSYHKNKEKRNKAHTEYCRTRYNTSPLFRTQSLLRTRLNVAITRGYKTGSAVRDLGMPIDAFLTYLNLDALDKYGIPYTGNESKFHIDHIRPLASFDLQDPEQLRIAVRWDNLQVLRAEENLRKGAKYG